MARSRAVSIEDSGALIVAAEELRRPQNLDAKLDPAADLIILDLQAVIARSDVYRIHF